MHNKIIMILANEQRGRTTQTFTHAQPGKQGGRGEEGRRGGEGGEGRRRGAGERRDGREGWNSRRAVKGVLQEGELMSRVAHSV